MNPLYIGVITYAFWVFDLTEIHVGYPGAEAELSKTTDN